MATLVPWNTLCTTIEHLKVDHPVYQSVIEEDGVLHELVRSPIDRLIVQTGDLYVFHQGALLLYIDARAGLPGYILGDHIALKDLTCYHRLFADGRLCPQ